MKEKKRDNVIEQIRLLAALQDGSNYEGEVAAAAARIKALMEKYSIEWAEVELKKSDDISKAFEAVSADTIMFNMLAWHWRLARLIAKVTHTRNYQAHKCSEEPLYANSSEAAMGYKHKTSRGRHYITMAFFGAPGNVSAACELFYEWLIKIDHMSRKAAAEYKKNNPDGDNPRYFRSCWIDSCLSQMMKKVSEQDNVSNSTALAVFDEAIAEAYKEHGKRCGLHSINTASGPSGYSAAGMFAGGIAGQSMEISMPAKKIGGKQKALKGG